MFNMPYQYINGWLDCTLDHGAIFFFFLTLWYKALLSARKKRTEI